MAGSDERMMSSRLGGGLVVRDEVEGGVATEEDALTFMHRNRGRSDGDGRMWRALSEEALLPSRFPKRFSIILRIINDSALARGSAAKKLGWTLSLPYLSWRIADVHFWL